MTRAPRRAAPAASAPAATPPPPVAGAATAAVSPRAASSPCAPLPPPPPLPSLATPPPLRRSPPPPLPRRLAPSAAALAHSCSIWTCTSGPRCTRSCLLVVPAGGEAFPATTCTTNCQGLHKSAHALEQTPRRAYSVGDGFLRLGCELLHARCTSACWVAVELCWLSHTTPNALGHRPLPPSTTPPAPMAPHAGREAAPAAITSSHPAHCACSSAAACQRQAGARWAAVRGSALKSYDSALLQAGLLLPCATANQSWIELRATGSWKLCPVHSECRD
jgi:hypothetical protein